MTDHTKAAPQQVNAIHKICEHGRDAFSDDCGMCDAAGTNNAMQFLCQRTTIGAHPCDSYCGQRCCIAPPASAAPLPDILIEKLRTRAEIRRKATCRGADDRLANDLDEAASELAALRARCEGLAKELRISLADAAHDRRELKEMAIERQKAKEAWEEGIAAMKDRAEQAERERDLMAAAVRDAEVGIREDRFDWYGSWRKKHAAAIAAAERKGK